MPTSSGSAADKLTSAAATYPGAYAARVTSTSADTAMTRADIFQWLKVRPLRFIILSPHKVLKPDKFDIYYLFNNIAPFTTFVKHFAKILRFLCFLSLPLLTLSYSNQTAVVDQPRCSMSPEVHGKLMVEGSQLYYTWLG